MLMTIYSMNISLSIMFACMNHPMSMGLVLLAQTASVAMITGATAQNFWFSYILFIIMIGGMLVLFIYMTSVASNEKFKFSLPMMSMLMVLTMSSLVFIIYNPPLMLTSIINNMEISSFKKMMFTSMSMSKYLNYPLNLWVMILITYLLMALIAVVKITNVNYGPLRQKS